MVTELKPFSGQKSFYGKAKVINEGNTLTLQSYNTNVAVYDMKTDKVKVKGYYSQTTAKHINSFLQKLGKERLTKKQMELCENW